MPVFERKLHLGAFDQAIPGWLNTDVTPHLLVARVPALPWLLARIGVLGEQRLAAYRSGAFRAVRYLDVTRRFRFDDETFDFVYSSHVLEHLHPDAAQRCLAEAHRVLRPAASCDWRCPTLTTWSPITTPPIPTTFCGASTRGAAHGRSAPPAIGGTTTRSRSRRCWRSIGFRDVRRHEFREGLCPDLDQIETRRWSLFVEAVR